MEYFVPPDEAQQWYEYWCDERLDWYLDLGMPGRQAAPAAPRRRRAQPLLAPAPPTWSSSSRGAGTSSRASPTAATTTSPSTPTPRARSSSTSTRPPTSATCPTSSSRPPAPPARMMAFLMAAYDEEEVGGETRTVLRLHPRLAPIQGGRAAAVARRTSSRPLAREVFDLLSPALHVRLRRDPGHRPPLPPPGRDRHAATASPSTSTRSTTRPSPSATATRWSRTGCPIDRAGRHLPGEARLLAVRSRIARYETASGGRN